MSQDGRNWARIEGPHHTGALFDVGAEGEWDQLYIGSPQVCIDLPRITTGKQAKFSAYILQVTNDASLGRFCCSMTCGLLLMYGG